MSLLGIFVIIAYYDDAKKNPEYKNKITGQKFNVAYLKSKITELMNYQSDALHWNIAQITKIDQLIEKTIKSYEKISTKEKVQLHSLKLARTRLEKISESLDSFMTLSRGLARRAQMSEGSSEQPAENVDGTKSIITITNYLGGKYFLTADEVQLDDKSLVLVEAKHSKIAKIPSISDIKDGLVKMCLFSNLEDAKIGTKKYKISCALKLTSECNSGIDDLSKVQRERFQTLLEEGKTNGFQIIFNDFSQ
ncbi:MAG: hypothetical protein ACTSUB_06580, partial [Candidatus Thorarchaeota archaeon]